MPSSSIPELTDSLAVVTEFSEEAFGRAIEAARDPRKAEELIGRLQERLAERDMETEVLDVSLCVALGEARVEAAVPVLLEAATQDEPLILQEAAAYALQRMGKLAFPAVVDLLATNPAPMARVFAYEILSAALDADDQTRAWIKEQCIQRAALEAAGPLRIEGWSPFLAVATTLRELGETRLRPYLESALQPCKDADDRSTIETMLGELDHPLDPDTECVWRDDWPGKCREWFEEIQSLSEGPTFGFDSHDDAQEAIEDLLEEFADSTFAGSLPNCSNFEAADDLAPFLEYGLEYTGLDARDLDFDSFRETLYEITPRKISADMEYFESLTSKLSAFVSFLHATGRLEEPRRFREFLREARIRLPRLAANPGNWGMAKSLFMPWLSHQGTLLNNDAKDARMDDDSHWTHGLPGVRAQRNHERQEALVASGDSHKIGRNAPCPCGSGHKFKKCCGRA
jgi:hypothetical protein